MHHHARPVDEQESYNTSMEEEGGDDTNSIGHNQSQPYTINDNYYALSVTKYDNGRGEKEDSPLAEHFTKATCSTSNKNKSRKRRGFFLQKRERAWNEMMGAKTGIFFSVWNLINDVLSPGTVGMSQYVAQSGLIFSIILFVFFGVITTYTLCILFDMAKKHNKKSLPELADHGFGKLGYIITCIFMVLFNFGGVCGQFLMFGQVVPELLVYLYGEEHFLISRTAVLIYLTIFLLPIASMRDLGDFAIISFVSVSCVLTIAFIVFYKALAGEKFNPPNPDTWQFIHPEALSALGGMSYIYVCHDLSFNVFGGLKKSTKVRYYSVVMITMILTVITCATIGISGYFLFFDLNLENANVLQLLPRSDVLAIVGRCFLAVDIALAIPYSSFMPRLGLTYIVTAVWPSVKTDRIKNTIFHYGATLLCVLAALGVALTFTDLGAVFEITGGVSACSLAYIIPPLLLLKLEKGWFKLNKLLSFLVLCIGLAIFGCSISSVIYGIVAKYNKKE